MRYLSGVQPTGELHLGNYFGVIKQQLELQEEAERSNAECFFFIADYHALTNSSLTKEQLENYTYHVAATYLALGLNPWACAFFRQSDVMGYHPELALILSNSVGVGMLERSHAYSSKVEQGIKPNAGLFYYPVLMAADILLYDADLVPVGADQKQHMEMAKHIANSFNFRYGETFKVPQERQSKNPKVLGTDGRKMSKSYGNTIPILAPPKKIKKCVMSIKTDSTDYKNEPLDPDKCTVFHLYSLFAPESEQQELRDLYINDRSFGYGDAKILLADKINKYFKSANQQKESMSKAFVRESLINGAKRARRIAKQKIAKARKAVGLPELF